MIDEVVIQVRSGRGGDGMVHFHREKYVTRGGPDGGDGGRGGDVILEVMPTKNTLAEFRHKARYFADDGKAGGPSNMTGRSASDLVILVPPGTVVYDQNTDAVLGDLVASGQRLVVCKGGRGGRGNQHFATASRQAPRIAEKGEPSEEKQIRLELKLIADVGIVGVPNAGKSSLLAALTNASPKIADYPFTTLEPNLGVVELDRDTRFVMADIPGLIEGAHAGAGLGDAFLRHIQRTRVLVHLLDGLAEDPLLDFAQINSEMALFDETLAEKPQLVVLNKMDMPEVQDRAKKVERAIRKRGYEFLTISALARTGLEEVVKKVAELLQTAPSLREVTEMPVYRAAEDPRAFTITQVPEGWKVSGASIERAASMTYWEYEDSLRRFHHMLVMLGIDQALRDAGVQQGDTVWIGDYELEWQD
ncbi:MAG TPA: GTPase ObgE [Anaerolineaceae bacterium]|nr:GTPase ObgE [Anaerolineaceae bacterium]